MNPLLSPERAPKAVRGLARRRQANRKQSTAKKAKAFLRKPGGL
jgi:hypothetical protein